MMDAFRTPFWTDEKGWLVIGTWHPDNPSMEMYTSLVSTPNYLPSCHPHTITVTNFSRQDQLYTKHEDVLRLQLVSCGPNQAENTVNTDDENHQTNNNLFPNVTELSVVLNDWNSIGFVPSGLDLLNVTHLSLTLPSIDADEEAILAILKYLLRQTPNLNSLKLIETFIGCIDPAVEQICKTVVRDVNPSKLRHLTISVIDVGHVQQLIEAFRDLLSIQFDLLRESFNYGEIVKFLRTLRNDYSIEEDESLSFINKGRRRETIHVLSRSRRIHHLFTRCLT